MYIIPGNSSATTCTVQLLRKMPILYAYTSHANEHKQNKLWWSALLHDIFVSLAADGWSLLEHQNDGKICLIVFLNNSI